MQKKDEPESLAIMEAGKNEHPLITHCDKPEDIEEADHLFENQPDNIIKIVITH